MGAKADFLLPILRAFEPHPADNVSTLETDSGSVSWSLEPHKH